MNGRDFLTLLKDALDKWSKDKASRIAAALAFYTALSLAPLLVIAVGVANIALNNLQRFGDFDWVAEGQDPREAIVEQVATNISPDTAEIVQTALDSANEPSTSIIATVLSVATLLFGASGLFGQLQDALNSVWKVPPKELKGIVNILLSRLLSVSMVLVVGFLLLASLLLSVAISVVTNYFADLLPAASDLLPLLDIALSLLIITLLFALIFRSLPRVAITWRDVGLGAVLTSILFIVGKYGLSFYLSQGSVGSAYGAAGSIVVLLVWVYYSGQILLYGAEFTYVYAHRFGSMRLTPTQLTAVPPSDPAALPALSDATTAATAAPQRALPAARPPVMEMIWAYTAAAVMFLVGIIVGASERRSMRKRK